MPIMEVSCGANTSTPPLLRITKIYKIMKTLTRSITLAAASAALTASLSSGSAQAIVVNVSGIDYNVTTFTGPFPFPVGPMPWFGFGNSDLALEFAEALAAVPGGNQALNYPSFGYYVTPFDLFDDYVVLYWQYNPNLNPPRLWEGGVSLSFSTRIWAQAAPVPGPLPIFGAAAAFGMSRRLRRRVNLGA
jgi:hypothetical protein